MGEIIKKMYKKLNYPQKNVGLAHGFKTMCKASYKTHGFIVHGSPKQSMVLGGRCTWF